MRRGKMLETFNDWLSFIVLMLIVVFCLRIMVGSFFNFRTSSSLRHTLNSLSRYNENEDE